MTNTATPDENLKCSACDGTGEIMLRSYDGDYDGDLMPCHFCNGSGALSTDGKDDMTTCENCGGEMIHRLEGRTDNDGAGPSCEEWRECVECAATADADGLTPATRAVYDVVRNLNGLLLQAQNVDAAFRFGVAMAQPRRPRDGKGVA